MNCTLSITADTLFDELLFANDTETFENIYATVPMPVVTPVYVRPDEEELYTSFEEAISDRVLAMRGRLSRSSDPLLYTHSAGCNTDVAFSACASTSNTTAAQASLLATSKQKRSRLSWQRATIFTCAALSFALIGFDLMGILMLHVH